MYMIRFQLTKASHASTNLSLPTELVLQGTVVKLKSNSHAQKIHACKYTPVCIYTPVCKST